MSTVGYILKEEELSYRAKEKLTSPPGQMGQDKKIALTEIRAGGGRVEKLPLKVF